MKKENVRIIAGIGALIIVGVIVWGAIQNKPKNNELVPESPQTSPTTTATSTAVATTTKPSATNEGITITNVQVKGTPDGKGKAYFDQKLGFVLAYPETAQVIQPSPTSTPGLYRTDREFAYCIKQLQTPQGCQPAFTVGLPDGSGHGVSVYVLDNTKVQAQWPEDIKNKNIFINATNNGRYELYYSDTRSISATAQQNKDRQDLMAYMAATFSFVE